MKKKSISGKLNLSKKTISSFQSIKIRGGDEEPVKVITAEPTVGGCQEPTVGGAPSCWPCRDLSVDTFCSVGCPLTWP